MDTGQQKMNVEKVETRIRKGFGGSRVIQMPVRRCLGSGLLQRDPGPNKLSLSVLETSLASSIGPQSWMVEQLARPRLQSTVEKDETLVRKST